MIEVGKVYKIDKKNRAIIRFSRKTACENCNMCLKRKDEMFVELVVENTKNAQVGDTVSVHMGTQVILLSSIIAYLIPVVLVAVVLLLTRQCGELLSFGLAMVTLVISYVFIAMLDKWIKKRKNYAPSMVSIINEEVQK